MNLDLTVDALLMDESFIDFCLNKHSTQTQKWENMAAADPANKAVIEEARNWLNALHPSLNETEIATEILKVKKAIQRPETTSQPEPATTPASADRKVVKILQRRVAAALLLAISLPLVYFLLRNNNDHQPVYSKLFAESGHGERKQILLPDSSTVILKSNSRIFLDDKFNETDRQIRLEGQAYFAVYHNAAKPMTVHSGNFSTTALGTAFMIDADNSDRNYQVQLVEGKILVRSQSEEQQVLKPGTTINWIKENAKFETERFDQTYMQNWISGILEFNHSSDNDVFTVLQNWYSVRILDKRAHKKQIQINGNYSDLPLNDILEAVCFTLNCKFRFESNTIIIN